MDAFGGFGIGYEEGSTKEAGSKVFRESANGTCSPSSIHGRSGCEWRFFQLSFTMSGDDIVQRSFPIGRVSMPHRVAEGSQCATNGCGCYVLHTQCCGDASGRRGFVVDIASAPPAHAFALAVGCGAEAIGDGDPIDAIHNVLVHRRTRYVLDFQLIHIQVLLEDRAQHPP